jgi:pimeloyl-ACP methyl ester carboxylesterase
MQTKYLERPEGKLAYSDYGGDGPIVFMLPGMGALRSEYRFLAPELRTAGYHPVTVDLRGQGESSVPWDVYDVPSVGSDILALIDHLGGAAAHLIGTSFSAAPLVWSAVERPECTRSLVLIGPFVRSASLNPFVQAIFWIMLHNPWRAKTWTLYYGTIYPTRKPADFEDYLGQLEANMKEKGRFDAAVALGNSSRRPSVERLPNVKAPVLVVMGSKDPDFPDPEAEGRYIVGQAGGRLELIDGAGHYPQTEMPEKTTPVITNFLKMASR